MSTNPDSFVVPSATMQNHDIWPDCLAADSAFHTVRARPVNWTAACARTQARFGCDIGEAGRALVADMGLRPSRLRHEGDAECRTGD